MGGDGGPSHPRQDEKEPSTLLSVFGEGFLCIGHAGGIEAGGNVSPAQVFPWRAACHGSWEVGLTPNFPVPGELLLTAWKADAAGQSL